jgi:uncharacterized protein (DUF1501 family)
MYINNLQQLARRAFLRRTGQLALAGVATPWALNLAALGEAAAFDATDYKALVCVFLYGGNDYGNTLVPFDNINYDLYSTIRGGGAGRTAGGIALAQSDLAATALNPSGGQVLANGATYALHPKMTAMKSLFDAGKMAVQLNVGPLVIPMTKAQYLNADRKTYPLPPKLFSHNDQQSVWQSSAPEGSTTGWGGQIGDLALSSNTSSVFTCISVTGNAVYLSGDTALQYQVSPSGAVPVKAAKAAVYGSTAVAGAITSLIQKPSTQTLEYEYTKVTSRSIAAEVQVSSATSGITINTSFNRDGVANSLADQLLEVAKLIAARSALGAKRQVFMVSLGGFDTHDFLLNSHNSLLNNVDEAIGAFYNATVELGVQDKVTTFTASDFGRTLASNGDGSDHGWGSHHFVVGGAVQGSRFYGTAPAIAVNGNDDVGQGRLLPTTSVDQYAATLASWFGVAENELAGILPNLSHFGGSGYPINLGFMA